MDPLSRLHPHVPAFLGAVLGAAVIAWLGLVDFGWNDYAFEAAPAYKALAHGDVGQFFALCPFYGGAMLLRAPLALLPGLWGGGEVAVYRAVAAPALIAAVALAVWLAARMRAQRQPLLNRVTAVALVVASPVSERALELGHSEEILGGVLCVVAMLVALRGRPVWAGLLIGLAVAAKPWALVAVVPVLLALGPRWWRGALVAAMAVAAIAAPLAVGAPDHFRETSHGLTQTGVIFQPWQGWWFYGEHDGVVRGSDGRVKPGYRTPPAWVTRMSHPLVVLVGLVIPLLWLLRPRRGRDPGDLLLVLALTLHLRCLLDTWNIDYYAIPALLALLTWETVVRRRAPVLTLALTVVNWITFQRLAGHVTPDDQALFYLAWSVPLAAWLTARAFGLAAGASRGARAEPAPA